MMLLLFYCIICWIFCGVAFILLWMGEIQYIEQEISIDLFISLYLLFSLLSPIFLPFLVFYGVFKAFEES